MAHDVFLSYSQKDKATADAVCRALEYNGVRVWMAPRDIPAGGDWPEAIPKAITEARALVLVFSASANASRYIPRELEEAGDKQKPIITIRLTNVAPSGSVRFFISTSQWLDAFPPPLDAHLDNLVRMTRKSLGLREQGAVRRPSSSSPKEAGTRAVGAAGSTPRVEEIPSRRSHRLPLIAAAAVVAVVGVVTATVMSLTSGSVATTTTSGSVSPPSCGGTDCPAADASYEALPGLDQPSGFFKVLAVDTLEVDGRRIPLAGIGTILSNKVASLNNWMLGKGYTVLCQEEQPFHGRYTCNVGADHSNVSDYVLKRGWAEPLQNASAQN